MKCKQLFDRYKNQPVLQAAFAVWITAAIIKTAIAGFEFGHWLKVH